MFRSLWSTLDPSVRAIEACLTERHRRGWRPNLLATDDKGPAGVNRQGLFLITGLMIYSDTDLLEAVAMDRGRRWLLLLLGTEGGLKFGEILLRAHDHVAILTLTRSSRDRSAEHTSE